MFAVSAPNLSATATTVPVKSLVNVVEYRKHLQMVYKEQKVGLNLHITCPSVIFSIHDFASKRKHQ